MVVAADKKGVIGREDRIPWRLKEDLVNLRNKTKGKPVILGRKSYDSMAWYYTKSGNQMPGQLYVVVTHNATYVPKFPNAVTAHSVQEALALAQKDNPAEVVVLGGASIYRALLPYTDRIYLTEVQAEVAGDTSFPELASTEWQETARIHHTKDDRNEYDFDFVTLDRK